MFGGLLNTLSQGNSVAQIKKRQEIEKKQAVRAAKAREEDDGRKKEKLEKLRKIRVKETKKFNEKTVGTLTFQSIDTADQFRCEYNTTTSLRWHISYLQRQNQNL